MDKKRSNYCAYPPGSFKNLGKKPRGINPKLLAELERDDTPVNPILEIPKSMKRGAFKIRRKVNNARPLAELALKEKLQENRIRFEQSKLLSFKFSFRVADFYLPDYRLIIEVDGSSHNETFKKDLEKDQEASRHGIRTIRIRNRQVLNFKSIFEQFKKFEEESARPHSNLVDPRASKSEIPSVENAAPGIENQDNLKEKKLNDSLTLSMATNEALV